MRSRLIVLIFILFPIGLFFFFRCGFPFPDESGDSMLLQHAQSMPLFIEPHGKKKDKRSRSESRGDRISINDIGINSAFFQAMHQSKK